MSSTKKEYQKNMNEARRTFNSNLLKTLKISISKSPNDKYLQEVETVVKAINTMEPDLIIRKAGPYLFKYKEKLASKDESFFLQNSFNDDLHEYYANGKDEHDFDQEDVVYIMQSFKDTWISLTPYEKETIWSIVSELFRSYARYIGSERGLKKLTGK